MLMLALTAWHAAGWFTLGLFCKWGADEEYRVCDILFMIAMGPLIPFLMLCMVGFFIAIFLVDKALSPFSERCASWLPSFSCPIVWRRK